MIFNTRFAPSPTGPLHLGHAYSALLAHDRARAANGQFYLRMDDIDQSRARVHWAEQIQDDLSWLGISWDGPIWSQHQRSKEYREALQRLWDMGLLYACTCTRADVKAAANAPQEGAPLMGPDGIIYPGTCRHREISNLDSRAAVRINMKNAMQHLDCDEISFIEGREKIGKNRDQMINEIGDVVLARKDMAASYHLSIVVDDKDQNITHVIRGEDLRDATFIHVLLQRLLGYPTPEYTHHKLIRDENGKRLAKRDDARAIAKFREDGASPKDIRMLVGL
ncbi:tRNA glutamyl-Q(34) synthetase GluQRS [Planktotalea sp.]|uniref:tRNA glutamyl-Q(34) synthetase GluQRS n=1 Tax=Planktotalea sp. TaxID=2029877 RepID=UPI003D6A46A1